MNINISPPGLIGLIAALSLGIFFLSRDMGRPHAVRYHASTGNFTHSCRKLILFGDSLTEGSFSVGGWGARLAHQYLRRLDIVNRGMMKSRKSLLRCLMPCHGLCLSVASSPLGFGGYNTRWIRHILDDVFQGCNGDNTALVTVFLGANDAAMPAPNGTE